MTRRLTRKRMGRWARFVTTHALPKGKRRVWPWPRLRKITRYAATTVRYIVLPEGIKP